MLDVDADPTPRPVGGVDRDAVERVRESLDDLVVDDPSLAPHTTYKVGGPAAVLVTASTADDLVRIGEVTAAARLPVLAVGRGSNLLVADAGFPGVAVLSAFDAIDIDEATAVVTAGSAVALPVLARRTARAGLTGFEWAVGVPGSIGGAVRMNAGGHGSDMSSSLLDVESVELATGRRRRFTRDELGLRFRGSGLPPGVFVVSARLQLAPGDAGAAEAEIRDIVRWRLDNQPGGQNAGSVFVNPVPGEVSAGQLIDAAGLRGERYGSAEVSTKHANFIQADPGGSADDVFELMRVVRRAVLDTSGYALRSEIRLVGFDHGWDAPDDSSEGRP